MDKNVKIPQTLLSQTIDLLEYWDVSGYDPIVQCDYENVYTAFLKKRRSLELRDDYAKIVFAEDKDARLEARMRYLQNKRAIIDDF
jgi:hypothetical protein